ncbi:hypothetical protein GCM10009737_01360 [Nocardioides lentus]|uniref:Uncharacterized protein n=1 Tax=Nocardioides lentus TaxID=338077 RepID=A0ABP5A6R0_9ACTN
MNALLKQTLEDRAADGPAPFVDVAALEAAGRARVRRRRLARGVGALAVLAALGAAAPYALDAADGRDRDPGQVAVDPGAPAAVSWAAGDVVRIGDIDVTLPEAPSAYVVVGDAVVWAGSQNGVYLTRADGSTGRIGATAQPYGRVLVAEGSLAGWYDTRAEEFVVYDVDADEVALRVPTRRTGGATDEFGIPAVRALDEGVLWVFSRGEIGPSGIPLDEGGVAAVEVSSGDVVQWESSGGNDDLGDVQDGRLALALRSLEEVSQGLSGDEVLVRTAGGGEVGRVPGDNRALLSPDATYVVTDPNDSEQVWDVATGADVTPDLGPYGFMAVAQWLDADRFQATAFTRDELRSGDDADLAADVLVCSVDAGSCETVATDVAAPGDLQLPVGENLGE